MDRRHLHGWRWIDLFALEQRDRFDVCGVRKHVHDTGTVELEAMALDQNARIARQRARMAGNVDDASHAVPAAGTRVLRRRRIAADRAATDRNRSSPRRARADRRQDRRCKTSHCRHGCVAHFPRRGAPARPRLRRRSRCATRRASGSVKLPRPQNRSSTRSVGCGSSKFKRVIDHAQVHAAVDLDEIERLEFDIDIVRGRRKLRCASVGPQRSDAVDAAGLQIDASSWVLPNSDQRLAVVRDSGCR